MIVSSDVILKYGFKFTVKDERVFCVFCSRLSRFLGWKFPVVWPEGVRSSGGKRGNSLIFSYNNFISVNFTF